MSTAGAGAREGIASQEHHPSHRWELWSRTTWTLVSASLMFFLFLLPSLSLDIVRPMVGFDEREHIDYAFQLSEGVIPVWGTMLSDRTMAVESCLNLADVDPSCVADFRASSGSAQRFSYQAQQPPLGYLPMTLAAGLVLSKDTFHYQQILILRLANWVTFAIFALAWAFTLSFFTRSLLLSSAVSGLLIANPWFFGAYTYVTNDSAAITYGAVLVAAYVAWLHGLDKRNPSLLRWAMTFGFIGLGVVGALVKFTSIIAFVAIALGILVQGVVTRNWISTGRRIVPFIAGIMGFLVAYVVIDVGRNQASMVSQDVVISQLLGPSYRSLPEIAIFRLKDFATLIVGYEVLNINYVTPGLVALGIASSGLILWALASAQSQFPAWMQVTPQVLIGVTLAVSIMVLIAVPIALHLQGPYESNFIARYLVPLLPLFALTLVPVLSRRVRLQWVILVSVVLVLLLFSVPSSELFRNIPL